MKTGVEYLHSKQKRAVDIALSSLLAPADIGAVKVAKFGFAEAGRLYFYQERTGQNADLITMRKIRTLDDNGVVLNGLAQIFRNKGLDELPQLTAIRSGEMSFFGSRPLIAEEYEDIRVQANETLRGKGLLAMHDDIVMPAKRGLLSRTAIHWHMNGYDNNVERRLFMDVQDHANASLKYDLATLRIGITMVLKNELLHGGNNATS